MKTNEHFTKNLKFITSVPDKFDKNKKYGVIILMHGYGASMYDLVDIAPIINDKDFIYIFPNAPIEIDVGFGKKGYAWFPIETVDISESDKLLNLTIKEALTMFEFDKEFVFIGGFSQGGMMTIHSGISSNIPYSGAIILSSKILLNTSLDLDINTPHNTRIFMTHGKLDTVISIEEGRTTRNKLINLGFNVDYHEYNIGHEINLDILSELSKWLLK
jgi:phospholipase/carboxylesterase